jgi:hypothetical protein
MINTSTALNIAKKDVSFLDADIHDNVSFEKIRHEKSPNGNNFIEFTFNKNGAAMTHTEYEPTRFPDQTEENFIEKVNTQVARILQILEAFYDREKLKNFEAASFNAFAQWVVSLMNGVNKDEAKVRLKVVYNNSGYTTLPRYAVYTFIESMNIPASKSKIKRLGIDQFERPESGDASDKKEASTAASYFNTTQTTANAEIPPIQSGMPF